MTLFVNILNILNLFNSLTKKKARGFPRFFLHEILLAQLLNLMKHLIDLSATAF